MFTTRPVIRRRVNRVSCRGQTFVSCTAQFVHEKRAERSGTVPDDGRRVPPRAHAGTMLQRARHWRSCPATRPGSSGSRRRWIGRRSSPRTASSRRGWRGSATCRSSCARPASADRRRRSPSRSWRSSASARSCASARPAASSPFIEPGDVIVSTAAVRLDGTSGHFAPMEFPAVADFDCTTALVGAARATGADAPRRRHRVERHVLSGPGALRHVLGPGGRTLPREHGRVAVDGGPQLRDGVGDAVHDVRQPGPPRRAASPACWSTAPKQETPDEETAQADRVDQRRRRRRRGTATRRAVDLRPRRARSPVSWPADRRGRWPR